MFFALLIVPMAALAILGGPEIVTTGISNINPALFNPFLDTDGNPPLTIIAIVSMLAWGAGLFWPASYSCAIHGNREGRTGE